VNRPCPYCGAPNDCDTYLGAETYKPTEGDVSLCFSCGELCVFGPNAESVLKPTEEQRQRLMDNPRMRQRIFQAQMAIPKFNQKVRREPKRC